jgi:hypothetical protein
VKRNIFKIIGFVLLSFSVIAICYFTKRTEFLSLIQLSIIGWIGSLLFIQNYKAKDTFLWIFLGIILKLILLFSTPQLSDDYYRFFWDGTLVANSENPYLNTPLEISENNELSNFQKGLYDGMNSKEYFAVYLPFNQIIFGIISFFGTENLLHQLIGIRLLFLLSETLLFIFIWRQKKLNRWWFLFFFNPFIMVESYGNLHFELLMVCLFAIGYFYLKNFSLKGFFLGLGAAVKPYILLFLPFVFIKQFKQIKILSTTIGFFIGFGFWWLLFLYPQAYQNMLQSILLFIKTFEFNASIFYLVRWLGFEIVGYDVIKTVGPIMSFIVMGVLTTLVFASLKKPKQALNFGLYGYTFYLLMATTVHPWYIIPLLFIAAITKHIYPFVWAMLIWFSYKAYQTEVVSESALMLCLEYLPVFSIAAIEIYFRNKSNPIFLQNLLLNLYTSQKQSVK